MTLPIITDPYFYAVTIPAVLLLGVSKSGFGAGFVQTHDDLDPATS